MDFENPFLATSPDDAAIIKMAIDKLGVPFNSNPHRSSKGSREIMFNLIMPSDADNEKFKQAIVDVELDIELEIDPAYKTKFEILRQDYSTRYPFDR